MIKVIINQLTSLAIIIVQFSLIIQTHLHSDTGLNIYELVEKYNYKINTHIVKTNDGYLLKMHRIGNSSKKNQSKSSNQPILLMHGLLSSSMDWLNSGPQKALGFLLVNLGYDVWLGNQRGNTWSRNHTFLDHDKNAKEFFNFSFHKIGIYDLTAKIDYILLVSGHKQLYFIGHSQGTTAAYVMLSEKPEYNEKIKFMISLAPVAFMEHIKSPFLKFWAKNSLLFNIISDYFKFYEFLPHYTIITEIGKFFCNDNSTFQEFCAEIFYIIAGYDPEQLNKSLIPVIASNDPAGASLKQIKHFLQVIKSKKFCQYDYGVLYNIKFYGQIFPPNYNLSNNKIPIALYYAKYDLLSSDIDVEILSKLLPNVVSKKLIDNITFNHVDFLWGRDVVNLVYNDVIEIIENN